jgi:hypothetical protein
MLALSAMSSHGSVLLAGIYGGVSPAFIHGVIVVLQGIWGLVYPG